jgi:3',5'-nucleoside bisphosphate phosphatase
VVARARAGGLDVIALTDHDTVGGVAEASAAAAGDVHVIPGIEISASQDARELHVLGYFVDPSAAALVEYTTRASRARQVRIRQMIDRLAALDVAVDYEAVVQEAGPDVDSLARPHLARALHAAGRVGSVAEAFERYIGDDGPAYVAARLVDAASAIAIVHEAGGLAVWAHPPIALLDELMPTLVEAGLDGVECYRPRVADPDLRALRRTAKRHGLLTTGGSDWHGDWHGPLGTFHLGRDAVAAFLERGGL